MPSVEKEKCVEAMDVMKDWETWLETLEEGLEMGRSMGMSEDRLKSLAKSLLDYITGEFCASTDEQKILSDMWSVSTEDERKVLVDIFFKLMEKEK